MRFRFQSSLDTWRIRLCLFVALLNFLSLAAFAGVGGPAGILLYHREGEEIFLLLADHRQPSTRGWGGFGGSYEEGETPAQTAARETEEETRGFFKRAELLEKIKDKVPFEDGPFSLFFVEIDHVPAERIATSEIPKDNKSYEERGPWAWIPLSEVMQHLKTKPNPRTAALVDTRLLPQGPGTKYYWPIWLSNMYRALNAGALPWMKSSNAKVPEAKPEGDTAQVPEH